MKLQFNQVKKMIDIYNNNCEMLSKELPFDIKFNGDMYTINNENNSIFVIMVEKQNDLIRNLIEEQL